MKTLLKLGMALGLAIMMAEVEVTPKVATDEGVEPEDKGSLSASDTYLIPNNGRLRIRVNNAGAEATTVKIVTPGKQGGLDIAEREVVVGAGKQKVIGPFQKSLYNNEKEQIVLTLTKVASVTISPVTEDI